MNTQVAIAGKRPWIGGSSISGILGFSPFSTPLQEWLKLMGKAPDADRDQEEFFAGRKALEPYVAQKLRSKFSVIPIAQNERYRDPEFPFLAAEIDAETELENYEIKTVSQWVGREFGEQGSDDFPVYIAAQVQWGLGVRPKPTAWLAACIGFDDLRRFPVAPDLQLITTMRKRAVQFWHDHVLSGIAPDPVNLDDTRALWPKSIQRSVLADQAMVDALLKMADIDARIATMGEEKDALKLALQVALADNEAALGGDGKPVVTWKSNKESVNLDKDRLITVYEAELCKGGIGNLDWIKGQRAALTSTKPGNRPLLNKLKK